MNELIMSERTLSRWRTLLILLCASSVYRLATAQEVGGEGEVDGNVENNIFVGHSPHEARELVCAHAKESYLREMSRTSRSKHLFTHWVQQLTDQSRSTEDYFSVKPFMPHPTSACTGVNTTCCKPAAEKQLLKVVSMEYQELYKGVLHEAYHSQCPGVGRKFYHVIYEVMKEVQRQLEIEVGQVTGHFLEGDFEELFSYLLQFVFHFDFCPLESHLQAHARMLFRLTYHMQGGKNYSTPEEIECFENVSISFVQPYVNKLKDLLEVQLSDLKLFMDSIKMAEEVAKAVQGHTFSPECVDSLMRLKYCAYCGGFVLFKPCLFFCINTLRGCMADVADIHEEFGGFVKALKTFAWELVPQLEPQGFIGSSLNVFVKLARDLKFTNLKSLVSSICEPTLTTKDKRSFTQTIQPQSEAPVTEMVDITYDLLTDIVNMELTCLGTLDSLLTYVPEEICYLSKNHTAHTNNHQCWTGNTLGSYDRPLVGVKKADQLNNPTFFLHPDPESLFLEEKAALHALTMKLNQTIDEYLCLDRDDEDCKRTKFVYSCGNGSTPTTEQPTKDPENSGLESGSSSGYYSGDGSELVDQETDDETDPDPDEGSDMDVSQLPPDTPDDPSDPDTESSTPGPDTPPPITMDTNSTGGNDKDDNHETIDILDTEGNPVNDSSSGHGSGDSIPEGSTETISILNTTTVGSVSDGEDVSSPPVTEPPEEEHTVVPKPSSTASGSAIVSRLHPFCIVYVSMVAVLQHVIML